MKKVEYCPIHLENGKHYWILNERARKYYVEQQIIKTCIWKSQGHWYQLAEFS